MTAFLTEHTRIKLRDKALARVQRLTESLKHAQAEHAYWDNLSLPLEDKKGPAK